MGEHVVNGGFTSHRKTGAGRVWGFWWGNGDTDDHHSLEVPRIRFLELKADALQASSYGDWAIEMDTAEKAWFDAQPAAARARMYEAAKD